jgi:outer membrane receptor protein involved in Fe transport
MEDYWTVGGKLSYKRGNWEIFVRAENLLGERYSSFETSNGTDKVDFNPAPGRTFEGGIRVEI